jgi:hypothetical protein
MIVLTISSLSARGDHIYSYSAGDSDQAEVAPLILRAMCTGLTTAAHIDLFFHDNS